MGLFAGRATPLRYSAYGWQCHYPNVAAGRQMRDTSESIRRAKIMGRHLSAGKANGFPGPRECLGQRAPRWQGWPRAAFVDGVVFQTLRLVTLNNPQT